MLIDGVFSGGGIKGFAYVGALQVLEEQNYRFKRVAGTSAERLWLVLLLRDTKQTKLKKY